MKNRRQILAGVCLVAGLGAVALTAAPVAASSDTSLTVAVTPKAMHPSGVVTVKVSHLTPNRQVTVVVAGLARPYTADGSGRLTAQVLVPAKATPRTNLVQVKQGKKSGSATIDVRVDWRTTGRDNAHSGVNPWERTLTASTVAAASLRWHSVLPSDNRYSNLVTQLSTYGDYGYTCTGSGEVTKLDLRDGSVVWRLGVPTPDPDQASACRTGGAYNDGAGHVWVGGGRLGDSTGAPSAGVSALSGPGSQPAVTDGVLVAGGSPTNCSGLGAADVKTGSVLWRSTIGGCGSAVIGGVVVTSDNTHLSGLDVTTGDLLWNWPDKDWDHNLITMAGNSSTIIANWAGSITAVDPATGKELWSQPESVPQQTSFTVTDDTVYYAVGYGVSSVEVVARSLIDGSILWRAAQPSDTGPSLTLANGLLYTGGTAVHVLDSSTGKEVQTIDLPADQVGVDVANVVPVNGHLYLGTSNGIFDYAAPGTP